MNGYNRLDLIRSRVLAMQRRESDARKPIKPPKPRIHRAKKCHHSTRYIDPRKGDALRVRWPVGPVRVPTERQYAALAFIAGFLDEHGHSPELADISIALGCKGKKGMQDVLTGCAERGLLTWWKCVPRTLQLTEAGVHALDTGEFETAFQWMARAGAMRMAKKRAKERRT